MSFYNLQMEIAQQSQGYLVQIHQEKVVYKVHQKYNDHTIKDNGTIWKIIVKCIKFNLTYLLFDGIRLLVKRWQEGERVNVCWIVDTCVIHLFMISIEAKPRRFGVLEHDGDVETEEYTIRMGIFVQG